MFVIKEWTLNSVLVSERMCIKGLWGHNLRECEVYLGQDGVVTPRIHRLLAGQSLLQVTTHMSMKFSHITLFSGTVCTAMKKSSRGQVKTSRSWSRRWRTWWAPPRTSQEHSEASLTTWSTSNSTALAQTRWNPSSCSFFHFLCLRLMMNWSSLAALRRWGNWYRKQTQITKNYKRICESMHCHFQGNRGWAIKNAWTCIRQLHRSSGDLQKRPGARSLEL